MSNTAYSNLRTGIAGAGLMGRWHAKTLKRLGVKPVAILDLDSTQANKLSSEMGGIDVYTDVKEMLSSAKLDVLHVCTPMDSHVSFCQAAIDAGVHVLVEKPVASSVEETERLLKAAENNNVKLCPVHQFGFQGGMKTTMARMESLGELLNVRFTTSSAGGVAYAEDALDDVVADIIPHPLSVLQRLRPGITLEAGQWQGVHVRNGELQVVSEIDGISVNISVSMNARPTRCEMELFFSQGHIHLNFFHGYCVIESGPVSRVQKMLQPFKYSLKEFFVAGNNLAKRMLIGEMAYPGLSHLVHAFYSSLASNSPVPITSKEILTVAKTREEIVKHFLPGAANRPVSNTCLK